MDIVAAADAYMADPSTTAFLFGEGYRLDLAKAVRAHEWASVTTANDKVTDHLKRAAVRIPTRFPGLIGSVPPHPSGGRGSPPMGVNVQRCLTLKPTLQ